MLLFNSVFSDHVRASLIIRQTLVLIMPVETNLTAIRTSQPNLQSTQSLSLSLFEPGGYSLQWPPK